MKRQLSLIIAILLLLASAAAAWWSRLYANDLVRQRKEIKQELDVARERNASAAKTQERIDELNAAFDEIDNRIDWEEDPTYILRWFADTATTTGVRLVHSQVMDLRSGEDLIGDNKLHRTQYTVRVQGDYARLVRYLDRVERSPHLMVVEKISMAARRDAGDDGELRLTVSSLCPVDIAFHASGENDAAPAGDSNE